jgi:hypothetical protein
MTAAAAGSYIVGRWIGHMAHGRLRHDRIAAASPIPGERVLGWSIHYSIGIAFAAGLVWIVGFEWLRQPTLAPALAFGVATVAAPFLVMQPGMGRRYSRIAHTQAELRALAEFDYSHDLRLRPLGGGVGHPLSRCDDRASLIVEVKREAHSCPL